MTKEYLDEEHKLSLVLSKYEGSHLLKEILMPVEKPIRFEKDLDNCIWDIRLNMCRDEMNCDAVDVEAEFSLVSGTCEDASTGLSISVNDWSKDNYLLVPGAVYAGNRFESRIMKYPPLLSLEDASPQVETIVSDIPRFVKHDGPSKIELLTGDCATPCLGFFAPEKGKGYIMLTTQGNDWGDHSIGIEEDDKRKKALIRLCSPGVRRDFRYSMCSTRTPSEDRSAFFYPGDQIKIKARIYSFSCRDIPGFIRYFARIRKDLSGMALYLHSLPFSSAWEIQEKKYNLLNWEEKYGYYSVGHRENAYQNFQTGWVGGMMSTYPLLFQGTELSRKRAIKAFDFFFDSGISPSGFFKSTSDGENWYSDSLRDNVNERWHLVRKSGDALYYIIKQFMLLEKQDHSYDIPPNWLKGTRACLDAFMTLWEKEGQFGQFADLDTGELIVGNSCSGGIVPAALALGYEYFKDKRYLETAVEAAQMYYHSFIQRGYTTGGPGEALQCPDSESAFGLLESYVTLYEVTKEKKWLGMAEDTADHCATWCISYNFRFPAASTFAKLDIRTTGAVYANAQNKHGAPGICTHSGASLFKLYRATGDLIYLNLIKDIAHNITQYLSREDRPIGEMGPGWMNERVNTSDWLEPVGEIFNGSCWCEVSSMLTFVEIPGLYLQPDKAFVCPIDHIDAYIKSEDDGNLVIGIRNTTGFRACVKVFSENSWEMTDILGHNYLLGCREVVLESGEEKVEVFRKEQIKVIK